ncbi:hypothetical protein [Nocardia tengchongensis]|uniref:hypothetical protein n=1 Tax=Nocardia tengchongensis TaxID=2055889 RepID=UPI0036C27C91
MVSANKQYTFGFKDGNLVLTSPDGRTLWESGTAANKVQGEVGDGPATHSADKFSMRFNQDGSIDILADGHHVWSNETPLAGAAKLVVSDDGSLLIEDVHGNVLLTLVGKDTVKHAYLVQLQPPLGASRLLWLKLYLAAARKYLQDAVDLMGVGRAEAVPDLSELLKAGDLSDTRDTGAMITEYSGKIDQLSQLKLTLNTMDVDVSGKTSELSDRTRDALDLIKHRIEDLKDTLRNPGGAFDAPDAVRTKAIDFTYNSQGGYAGAELRPETVQFLAGEINECIHQVDQIVKSVYAAAQQTGNDMRGGAPADPGAGGGGGSGAGGGASGSQGGGGSGAGGGGSETGTGAGAPTGSTSQQLDDAALFGDLVKPGTGSGATGTNPTGSTSTGSGSTSGTSSTQSGGTQSGNRGGDSSMMMTLMMGGFMLISQLPALIKALTPDDTGDKDSGRHRDQTGDFGQPAPEPAPPPPPEQPAVTPATLIDPPPAPETSGSAPRTAEIHPRGGSRQMVSQAVHDAVTREENNPNGCDARAAYAGTPGADQTLWKPIDSSQVQTGDIAVWANRTAVLVREPTGLRIMVNRMAVAFDPNHLPEFGVGDFGAFNGYVHPAGLDAVTPAPPAKAVQVAASV